MSQPRRGRPRSRPAPPRSERYRRRMLHALLELYQLLRTPLPLDTLLQAILDTAIRYVPGAQKGSLLVLGERGLEYRAAAGYSLEALRPVVFPVAMIDHYLGTGRVSQVDDFAAWDAEHLSPETNAILREHGGTPSIRRSVIGRVYVSGRFYGALVLDNLRDHRPFPPEAETLARLFSEQAGLLIEQALLLERLRQTNTQLVEAEKLALLGRFIASIAHEINNPLTAVLGYADFLTAMEFDADVAAMLGQLRHGAERVRTIVRNLQLFARQQRGGEGPVNLNLLAEQGVMLKRGELLLDQIEVRLALAPDLPYSWADGGQLSQVILNLLANAQHALRLRPPPRLLTISTVLTEASGGKLMQLTVTDNGPGISPEVRPRIFDPFFTTKSAGEGTGLGLSICDGIVGAHGGAITVESAPGQGAVFTVSLPLRAAAPLPLQLIAPQAPGPPHGLRVLLVEDDALVVSVVTRSLAGANSVAVAPDGAAGLRMAEPGAFDLLLCDLQMPGMGGLELYGRLADVRPDLARRVLFISGDTSSQATRAALEATGRPLLSKPFRPEELFAAIAALGVG